MKRLLTVLLTVLCVFGLTACDAKQIPANSSDYQEISEVIVGQLLPSLNEEILDDFIAKGAEYVAYEFQSAYISVDGQGMINGITSWKKATEEAGAFVGINGCTVEYNTKGTEIVSNLDVQFEKRTAKVEIIFDDNLNMTVKSLAVNISRTLGEKMENAALNTLLGMGTVFIVLILLAFVISGFSIINKMQGTEKKTEAPKAEAPKAAVAEDLTDDSELVAVISAAIAAYEASNGGSADGYVVRSINRRPNNKWNKN